MIMKYENVINLLDNIRNQPAKFKIRNWVEINDDTGGTYNANSKIQFWSQVYVIIVMHIDLLKELFQ